MLDIVAVKPLEYAETVEDIMFRLNLLHEVSTEAREKHAKAHYVIPYTNDRGTRGTT